LAIKRTIFEVGWEKQWLSDRQEVEESQEKQNRMIKRAIIIRIEM
jgi:hypothetical protein